MKSLSEMPREEAQRLVGVLFDLDDTLLDGGTLTEHAYGALWKLSRAGLRLVPVTGRPLGWVEVLARQWPIDAAIAENGAVGVYREGGVLRPWDPADEATRRSRRVRLAQAYEDFRARFAEARMSDDTRARVSDIALDIGESQRVPEERVAAMAAYARETGLRTFVSSVHLHLTLDPADKASGVLALLGGAFGEDATAARSRYAYLGDSTNDAACFYAFATSIAVKNVQPFLRQLSVLPRYVASEERGAGFREIAERILALRATHEVAGAP